MSCGKHEFHEQTLEEIKLGFPPSAVASGQVGHPGYGSDLHLVNHRKSHRKMGK